MDSQATAAAAGFAAGSHLDKLRQMFTIVLQSHQPNCLQDAATFSMLLCTNSQLRETMLQAAAGGHLTVEWPTSSFEGDLRSMVQWLEQHVRLRTLKHLELCGDVLSTPVHAYGALRDASNMPEYCWSFCSRVASALASAVAYLPAGQHHLPAVQGWFCNHLLPASLSQLPGGTLTQFIITADLEEDPTTLSELSALTGLRELRLPARLGAHPYQVCDILPHMTNLTGLLLADPCLDLLQSIPCTLQELVLVVPCPDDLTLQIPHLTALRSLYLHGCHFQPVEPIGNLGPNSASYEDEGLTYLAGDADLPNSLQHLTVDRIRKWSLLLNLTQLKDLQLTGYPHRAVAVDIYEMPDITSITQIKVLQHPNIPLLFTQLQHIAEVFGKRPVLLPSLHVEVPATAALRTAACLTALGSLTSLTSLQITRSPARRKAAILTAAAVAGGNGVGQGAFEGTVEQLAAALSHLENLAVLRLKKLPLMAGIGCAAVGSDWGPVMAAVAALPHLRDLELAAMPLGPAVAGLSAAEHLTSLKLLSCQVDDAAVVGMVHGMGCCSCLQELTITTSDLPGGGTTCLSDVALVAICQHLPQLRELMLPDHSFTDSGRAHLTRLRELRDDDTY